MRLTVDTGPLAGTQIALDREHPTTLGSSPQCSLRIQEPGVAAEHAVVKALRDQGFGVKALSPGLRVNGAEVEAAPLHDGDVLELGTTRLTYGARLRAKGPQITGYKILGELGRGGMGVVYRAEQVSLHRQVALKVLDQRFTADAQFIARFVAEARAAAKLQHPNVVQAFDVDHDGATYYYAMELMHEGSLEDWLKKNGKMPVERALQVIADAASGLAYAEALRIVHRDIKPDNLMLDQHGTVKIADLGLARTDQDPEETLTGTPHFMAPEQVLRKGVDHRADLYALGCTFYRLVTGRTPFRGQGVKEILRAHVKDTAEPPHKAEPKVPAEVSAIIQKLMQKEPADRYQSAADLLEAVHDQLAPPAKKSLWIGLAAAAVLVAGAAIWWAVTRPSEQTVVEKYRDNPEALRLATENERLKQQARQDAATIALLQTRLSGLVGHDLATALDEVAAAHKDTRAAAEAAALAARTRSSATEAEQAAAGRTRATTAALAAVQLQVDQALAAGDPVRALTVVNKAAAPPEADAAGFTAGVAQQHQRVLAAAQQRMRELGASVEAARAAHDAPALDAAAKALAAILAADGGWPAELLAERSAAEQLLASARQAVSVVATANTAARWQQFDAALKQADGVFAALGLADFAQAAATMQRLAGEHQGAPSGEQAGRLAAAFAHAAPFADALAAAAQQGQLQLPPAAADAAGNGDGSQPIARWQREQGTLMVMDTSKRPPKELPVDVRTLLPEQWQALAQQIKDVEASRRDTFVAFMALAAHLQKARDYLASLNRTDDDSGTGSHGYAFGALTFEQALQQLPDQDAPWSQGVRSELQAARMLAAGLRALSERRNLAAAAHLDRLIADHPHSLAVALLP